MDKEKILISVIIPIYNVEDYLYQCISSVCAQTYTNIQIILVDDGSTDGSSSICDAFSEKDARIEVIHKTNGGLVSARKAGAERAVGEYISFVDGDDWIDDNTFKEVLEQNDVFVSDVIAYGCIEEYSFRKNYKRNAAGAGFYSGGKLEQLKNNILIGEYFFEWNILPHLCDKLIRRELVLECLKNVPDTISYAEDAACSYPCMMKANSILILDIVPYHYRQREGSIVKKQEELKKKDFQDIYRMLKKAFGEKKTLEMQLKYYMFFVLCLKGYSMIAEEILLFPFSNVEPGDNIFVYGAGDFGKVVKSFIEKSQKVNLCGWTDTRADSYIKQGIYLDKTETVLLKKYDKLVIAILNENICKEIYNELVEKGVSSRKIDFVKKEKIRLSKLPDWLEKV